MVKDMIEDKLKGITITVQKNNTLEVVGPVSDDEVNMMLENLDAFGI